MRRLNARRQNSSRVADAALTCAAAMLLLALVSALAFTVLDAMDREAKARTVELMRSGIQMDNMAGGVA